MMFTTNPIAVNRGVLQGDSLSPLLFNLIVNLGYSHHGALHPKHWFQLADYTVIITTLEQDSRPVVRGGGGGDGASAPYKI